MMTDKNQSQSHAPSLDEQVSAWLDGESTLTDSQGDIAAKATRFGLIGDVMRQDDKPVIDISNAVSLALENEPSHQAPEHNLEMASGNTAKIVRFPKPMAQFAIAASVALVAVIGVSLQPGQQVGVGSDNLPLLQTKPFAGAASPVSLSTEQPARVNAAAGLRELQQQRIGALVRDHQQQIRLASQVKQDDQK